jgi:ubiquinone/menaquinone biosynthesis C-methylase UbiE
MNTTSKLEMLKNLWAHTSGKSREEFVEDLLYEEDRERFWLILGGHIFFQTLSAAVRLDLFSLLSKERGLTRSQIATHLGIKEKPARILLLGCTVLRLLRKEGTIYTNSPLAELLLTRGSPKNIISFVELEHHVIYKAMHSFYDAIKANKNVGLNEFKGSEPTLYQRLVHYPDLEKIFQDAMEDISVQANAAFAQFVDLSHVKHLVDVGGGNGANIIELAKKYPALRASVFDSATVCQIARENFKAAGLANRLDAIAGNCFTDPFPHDSDCLLFAHFFTIWSEEKDRLLLKKCYDALPSGGSVVLFNMMQSDKEDGPLSTALGSPYFLTLATGEGMLYTWTEYETWMKEIGFTSIKRQELPKDHGVISGRKP